MLLSVQFKKKIEKKFLLLLNKITHGGWDTPMFNEISLDAPLCPVGRIMFYTSENVNKGHIFLTINDIQP